MNDAQFALAQDIAYGFVFGVGGMALVMVILCLIFGAAITTPVLMLAWALASATGWLVAFGFLHFRN